ncbi:MAG: hypothetical protein R3297_02185 [Desulfobulbales bacterium]|nr:hypothetical protein [Desulfobulbales bacterium]
MDNDGVGDTDAVDIDCQEMINCSDYTNIDECQMYPECRWNKRRDAGTGNLFIARLKGGALCSSLFVLSSHLPH